MSGSTTTDRVTAAWARAAAAWAALNPRQQGYLSATYDADQAAEAKVAQIRKDWGKPPPASEWRWLIYSIEGPGNHTTIQKTLKAEKKLDPGAGSSLAALERRALIEVRYERIQIGYAFFDSVQVRLTAAGRAAARAGLGVKAPVRPPAGMMSEWMWATLVRLYPAGDNGLIHSGDYDAPRDQRAPSWNALVLLRNRDVPLMEEFSTRGRFHEVWRVKLTVAGRRHYEAHHACYGELYPDIDAPAPDPAVAGAHSGLADHRPPRELLPMPGWRLLSALVGYQAAGRSPFREMVIRDHNDDQRWFHHDPPEPVPAAVYDIPCGLDARNALRDAGSQKVIDRMIAATPPLIAQTTVTYPRQRGTYTSVFYTATTAGVDHVRAHLAEYRFHYPDVPVNDDVGELVAPAG